RYTDVLRAECLPPVWPPSRNGHDATLGGRPHEGCLEQGQRPAHPTAASRAGLMVSREWADRPDQTRPSDSDLVALYTAAGQEVAACRLHPLRCVPGTAEGRATTARYHGELVSKTCTTAGIDPAWLRPVHWGLRPSSEASMLQSTSPSPGSSAPRPCAPT